MENNQYLYSVLNGEKNDQNTTGVDNNNSNIKLLNYQKMATKRSNYGPRKSRHSLFDPSRMVNIKLIAEDIRIKLSEMNKKNEIIKEKEKEEKEKEMRENKEIKKSTLIKARKKRKSRKLISNDEEKKEENDEIKPDENTENDTIIKHKRSKKKKTKISKSSTLKFNNKFRILTKVKNLNDSNDDDESEEDGKQYVIDPETNKIILFDFLIIISFVYYFLETTFSLCQEKCYCSINKNITFSDILLFANDLLFIIDFSISFFRGFYNYNYELVKANNLILTNFLKTDFTFDFLCALPFFSIFRYLCLNELKKNDYELCFKYEIPIKFLLLKMCKLIKTLKIKKITEHKKNQALDKFLEFFSHNYLTEKIIKILIDSLIYIGIFHFIISIHIFIGNYSYSNWLILTRTEDQSLFNVYITSLYFLITTLTTVGYGDITCQSLLERIFQIFILAFGSVFYPYVVSSIGNFIKNDSNAKIKQHNELAMLESIRRTYRNLPYKLYSDIYKYIESKTTSLKKYDINTLIESLPFTLKNSLLFAMYKTTIKNFKFFNKNDNSVFIAEVLNSFIPSISKKNEFLAIEGEMLEDIIFLKDGKISLNVTIDMKNQLQSILKYFTENFLPFLTEDEKDFIKEEMNNDAEIKSYISEKDKMKSNQSLKSVKRIKNGDDKKNINNDIIYEEEDEEEKQNDFHYIKVVDIRKNEHFGCVFLTLNKPIPLSLQVKSKFVELYLLKKDDALNISKNYPNIWRKIYEKEYQNLTNIKKYTFTVLRNYIKSNKLLSNTIKNLMRDNRSTTFELTILEKLSIVEDNKLDERLKKSFFFKGRLSKQGRLSSQGIIKALSLNYGDNKNKINKFNMTVIKPNLKKETKNKLGIQRNQNDLETFENKKLSLSYNNKPRIKTVHFSEKNLNNLKNVQKRRGTKFIKSLSDLKKKNIEEQKKQNLKKEKLKNLKLFLIESKKYFMNNKAQKKAVSFRGEKKENQLFSILKNKTKKSCVTKNKYKNSEKNEDSKEEYKLNLNSIKADDDDNDNNNNINIPIIPININKNKEDIESKSVREEKNINLNLVNKNFPDTEKLLKNLENICEEETDFSFCSNVNEEHSFRVNELSIDRNANFEILSSYSNLNKITKGKYMKDTNLQKQLKILLKKFYKYKNKNKRIKLNDPLVLRTILSSDSEKEKEKEKSLIKSENKTQKINILKENLSINSSYSSNNSKNINNIFDETMNAKNILYKKSFTNKKLPTNLHASKNNLSNNSPLIMHNKEKINKILDTESKVANKSEDILSNISERENSEKVNNKNSSLGINIKKDVNIYKFKNKEVEYIIDEDNNRNISKDIILIDNNSNKSINYKIYKKRKKKKDIFSNKSIKNKNKELINQMLGIQVTDNNITTANNIINTSSNNIKDNKIEFNSIEKMKNIENVNIYNIVHKNINKNLNIIDNNEKGNSSNNNKGFCLII